MSIIKKAHPIVEKPALKHTGREEHTPKDQHQNPNQHLQDEKEQPQESIPLTDNKLRELVVELNGIIAQTNDNLVIILDERQEIKKFLLVEKSSQTIIRELALDEFIEVAYNAKKHPSRPNFILDEQA